MPEPPLTLPLDEPPDDLPRALRREREARDREQRDREAREREGAARDDPGYGGRDAPPATVTAIDIPFFRLVLFFLKAALAAIPALLLLAALLFAVGETLERFVPGASVVHIIVGPRIAPAVPPPRPQERSKP